MPRKLSQVIDDENYFEWVIPIAQSAVEYIVEALREKYTAKFTVRLEPNYLMDNLMTVSMFFDTQRNRLYLRYKLDKDRNISFGNDVILYNNIYDGLYSALINDFFVRLSIIGDPTDVPENTRNRYYGKQDMTNICLRNDTQFLWNVLGEEPRGSSNKYFVQNRDILVDDIEKRLVKDSWNEDGECVTPKDIMTNYNNEVLEINNNYDFTNGNVDYDAAFAEYQNIYNKYFNRIPESIPEWKGFTISINVEHNFAEEQSGDERHNRGIFVNPNDVSHYLTKWAKDHGKYVPPEFLAKWGL